MAVLLQGPRRAAVSAIAPAATVAGTPTITALPSPAVAAGVAEADTAPAGVPMATAHLTAPPAPTAAPTPGSISLAGGPAPSASSASPLTAQATATVTAPRGTETTPLTGVRLPAEMRRHVAVAEGGLRAGQFEATIDDGGARSSVQVRFARADDQHPARLHITTTATDGRGAPVELVLIGDRSWQRQPDGRWISVAAQGGEWEQVDALLPRVAAAPDPATEDRGAVTILRWYDAGRNADVTLEVETATGTPRQLQQVTRGSGPTIRVAYTGWNRPVDIAPPPDPSAPATPTLR
jgi:hypothetical protein